MQKHVNEPSESAAVGPATLACLLDAVSEGIVLLDARGSVLSCNAPARALLGPVARLEDVPWGSESEALGARAVLDGESPAMHSVVRVDGRSVELIVQRLPSRDDAGPATAFVRVVDRTRTLAAEAEVARLRRLRLLGDLVAGITHGLQNVFTAAAGFSELLAESDPEPGRERSRLLENIRKAGDQGAHFAEVLLGAVRASRAERRESFALGGLLDDVEILLQKGVLPGCSIVRRGDEGRIVRGPRIGSVQLLVGIVQAHVDALRRGDALVFDCRAEMARGRAWGVVSISLPEGEVDDLVVEITQPESLDGPRAAVSDDPYGLVGASLLHRLHGGDLRLARQDSRHAIEILFPRIVADPAPR
jgi:signal transduction histidine kinase